MIEKGDVAKVEVVNVNEKSPAEEKPGVVLDTEQQFLKEKDQSILLDSVNDGQGLLRDALSTPQPQSDSAVPDVTRPADVMVTETKPLDAK